MWCSETSNKLWSKEGGCLNFRGQYSIEATMTSSYKKKSLSVNFIFVESKGVAVPNWIGGRWFWQRVSSEEA